MDKYRPPSELSGDWLSDDPPLSVESLQNDFSGLIRVFDRHLKALPPEDRQARSHILQARAAAERGLRLSRELIDLVKSSG
jgi:hypothetical protein